LGIRHRHLRPPPGGLTTSPAPENRWPAVPLLREPTAGSIGCAAWPNWCADWPPSTRLRSARFVRLSRP
jgi:hypothetical protein